MIAQVDDTIAPEDTARYPLISSGIDQSSETIPLFDITIDPSDSQQRTVAFSLDLDGEQ